MFKSNAGPRTYFGLHFDKIPVTIAEPKTYPRYTTLPRRPNYELSIFSSILIYLGAAGMIPVSMLVNKLAKNYIQRKNVTHFASIPGGSLDTSSGVVCLSSTLSSSWALIRFLSVTTASPPASISSTSMIESWLILKSYSYAPVTLISKSPFSILGMIRCLSLSFGPLLLLRSLSTSYTSIYGFLVWSSEESELC